MTATQGKAYQRILSLLKENFSFGLLSVVHEQDGQLKLQVATMTATDDQSRDLAKRTGDEVEKMISRDAKLKARAPVEPEAPQDPAKN